MYRHRTGGLARVMRKHGRVLAISATSAGVGVIVGILAGVVAGVTAGLSTATVLDQLVVPRSRRTDGGVRGRSRRREWPRRVMTVARSETVRRVDSDEVYVLDLCDVALGVRGSRQHRFDWLLGDPGRSGRRVRLPVDSYWPSHRLVVEYRELQRDRAMGHFDKPDRLTISGVHRGQQRALYDARREAEIPAHGLRVVVIKPGDLACDPQGRLRRMPEHDIQEIRKRLASA